MATRKFKVSGSASSAKTASQEASPSFDSDKISKMPNGPYRMSMMSLRVGTVGAGSNNEGEPKIIFAARTAEPDGTAKAKFNGCPTYTHIPAMDEFAGRLNRLIDTVYGSKTKTQIQKVKDGFWKGNIDYDEDTDNITKIGGIAVPDSVEFGANLKKQPATEKYAASMNLSSMYPASSLPQPEISDADEEEEEMDEEIDGDEEEEEEDDRSAELEAMTKAELNKVARSLGVKTAKRDPEDIIEDILEAEDEDDDEEEPEPEEDEDEDEESEEEDDELREELEALTKAKLKARAKANGAKLAEYRDLDEEGLVDFILDQEADAEDEDEDEEEEEPEPPKRKAGAAKRRTKGTDDPPF